MSVTVWDPKYNFHECQDCHFNFTSVSSATSMGLAGLTCRNSDWMRLGVLVRVTPVKRWHIQNRTIRGGSLTKALFPQVRAVTLRSSYHPEPGKRVSYRKGHLETSTHPPEWPWAIGRLSPGLPAANCYERWGAGGSQAADWCRP